MLDQADDVDFALAAFRDSGGWRVGEIAPAALESIDTLTHALGHLSGHTSAVGMIAVDEDFFVLLRVDGSTARVLLSDVSAAQEWELAQSVVAFLGLPAHEGDEDVPAGDLDLLADLGLHAADLGALLDEEDLYPDELLSEVAGRLGFGELFDDAVGLTPA